MCGRFVSASPPDQIAAYFRATLPETLIPANFNVAPTDDIYAIVPTPNGRAIEVFHWGLIPAWAKDAKIGQRMINARAETLAEKPAFKSILAKYRCIVPADGFFEWTTDPSRTDAKGRPIKQPHYIRRLDGEPLAFAGLWSKWRNPADTDPTKRLFSATVVTTTANETMAPIHDRMPVILPASAWATWLSGATPLGALQELLVPAPNGLLTFGPVSTDVNNVRNNGEHLIAPVSL